MGAVAKFFSGTSITPVVQPQGNYPVMPSLNIPFGQAGIFSIDGYNFDCRQPGLYRFKLPSRNYWLNRFVCKDVNGVTDLYALMSAVSWNQVYGSFDEVTLYPEQMTEYQLQTISNSGHYRKWRYRCGFVVQFLLWLLPQFGVTARKIQLNTGLEFNQYSDGHVAIETYTGGKWRFWDVSNGLYFTDSAGVHLNAREIMDLYRAGLSPVVVRIDATDKWSSDAPASFDLSVWRDAEVMTPDELSAWHRRVMQIPEIANTACLPPGTESKAGWLNGRGIQILSESAFNARFYP